MFAKTGERKRAKGEGKKRGHPGDDGQGERKKRGGEEGGQSQGDGSRKRLDALSVGYFRRVGERLGEGFDENEERGERDFSTPLEADYVVVTVHHTGPRHSDHRVKKKISCQPVEVYNLEL